MSENTCTTRPVARKVTRSTVQPATPSLTTNQATFTSEQPKALVMTDVEAARFLSQSVHTLRKHRTLGIGAAYCKMGRSVRYRLADLQDYVEKSAVAR